MKTILYKFEIDGVIYYYGLRKDNVKGIMIGMDDLKLENHIHQLYIPEELVDGVILNYPTINADYVLIKKILEDIVSAGFYDKCDIYTYEDRNSTLDKNIVVAYAHDNFVITNSKNHKFIINGLISKIIYGIDISSHQVKLKGYRGIRSKKSYIEYKTRYAHSHLRSQNEENSYCLGSSDLSTRILNPCNVSNLDIIYDIILLDNFVKWESLEGGPYVKMQQIFDSCISNYYGSLSSKIELTEEQLNTSNITLLYSNKMFNVNITLNNTQSIDIRKDVKSKSYYTVDNTNYSIKSLIEALTKNSNFDRPISYYFKGNKVSTVVVFTDEEVNMILSSIMQSNILNTEIQNRINEIINTDIFKPTLILE